jgi:hypothetical protein
MVNPLMFRPVTASSRPALRAAGSDMSLDPRPVGGLFTTEETSGTVP